MDLAQFARRYIARYLHWYAGGILAVLATNWLAVTIPLHVADAIDALRLPGGKAIVQREAATIALMGLGIIVVRTLSRVLFFTPGRLVEAEVKHDLFARLLRQQPTFLRKYPPGDLVSRASSDVNSVRLLVGFGVLQAVNSAATIVLAGVQMVRISPLLAGLVLIPILLGLVLVQFTIRRLYTLLHRMQAEIAQLSDHVLSSYQGVATIHAFAAEPAFVQRFDQVNEAYLRTSVQRSNLRVVIGPTLALAASLNVFLLLYVGGPMAIAGDLTVGDLVAFSALVALLVGPLRGTSFLLQIWKTSQVGLERLGEVMDPDPDRPDLPDPRPVPPRPPAIEIRGLSFAYPDEPDEPVLTDVSVSIPAGSTLGILGATGAGKTTLLRCLARLYNPPRGTVLVDGVDILELDLDEWRRRMALVPQRAFLFSEPLSDNVLMGEPDEGRLERILNLTTLDVDVAALPNGTASEVGESGIMLSGGQRQRVALARGLVRPHTALMLDDVMSAVDHATEHELITSLRSREERPTTLLVAHRVTALQHADQIIVLDHGRVVARGTHEQLIAQPGLYQDTWSRQSEEPRAGDA